MDYKIAKNTNLGEFDNKLVVFIGRLSWQKGPDIFIRLADKVLNLCSGNTAPHFLMYGRGPMERELSEAINRIFPQKPYKLNPLDTFDPKVGNIPQLGKIEPVLLEDYSDPASFHVLDRNGELTEERALVIRGILYRRGFQALKIQGEWPFTHLILMNDLDDGWHTSYLVEAPWLPTPKYLRGRTIELMGNIDWNERFKAFRGATVVVVPSRNEPYGMVIMEAIKCGVPVLYADEAGVAEQFDDKIGACPVTDEDSMANSLYRILYDYSHWEDVHERQRVLYDKLQSGPIFGEFLRQLEGN